MPVLGLISTNLNFCTGSPEELNFCPGKYLLFNAALKRMSEEVKARNRMN